MKALSAVDLVKSYRGRVVVDHVSIDIRQGEVVGLLGPNGAGKTTTFNIIAGLVRSDGGRVALNGEVINYLPMHERARRGIAYLPQEPSIFRKLTVEENVLFYLENSHLRLDEATRLKRTADILAELEIAHLAKSRGYALSGGERRRVEIARALVLNPHFFLLDEPFTGMDPIATLKLQEIILRMRRKGIGVLLIDHRVREALKVTDRSYIIFQGQILASGSPEELVKDKKARQFFLGEEFALH